MLGIVYAYKLGNHVWGPKAGFFSALFLAVMPGFYGQIFNDSKDIPFAALFSIALYNILRTYNQLPNVSYRLVVEVGVAIGLALGVRIGGIILLGYLLFFWATWLFIQWIKGLSSRHDLLGTEYKIDMYLHAYCNHSLDVNDDMVAVGSGVSVGTPFCCYEGNSALSVAADGFL